MRTKIFCLVVAVVSIRFTAATPPQSASDTGALKWDAEAREIDAKAGERNVTFVFAATNVSNASVIINQLHASCGCTAAKLPSMPYTLGIGSNVSINVEMQIAGKHGLITKSVTVDSTAGLKTLTVSANISTDIKTTETK
jgi:hypothetical protein